MSKSLADNPFITEMKDKNGDSWYHQIILELKDKEIEKLNIIINRIKSIYSSLCFSAPENNYIFIEQLGEVLQELKGSDKVE